jgi:hypothetical protein
VKWHEKLLGISQFIALLYAEEMTDRRAGGTILFDNPQGC